MEAIKGKGRRASLLAGVSMLAGFFVSAAPVMMAPTAAHAANECGDPNANGAAADNFICTDTTTYPAITYTTNGALTLQLRNDVTTTTGGLSVTSAENVNVTITRATDSPANSGDPQITSTTGAGLSVVRTAPATSGNINVNLTDNDLGDLPELAITGTTFGINLSNIGSGSTTLTTVEGTITATDGVGVRLSAGTGNVTFTNGTIVTGTTGSLTVAGGANATVTNEEILNGAIVFNNTGNVTLNNNGAFFGAVQEEFSAVMSGAVTFNNLGTTVFHNNGLWTNASATFAPASTSTLNNNDTMQIDGNVELTGLDTFNNGHRITFGTGADRYSSDLEANDRLVLFTNYNTTRPNRGGGYTGESQLIMDVGDGGANQVNCTAAVGADCLDMRGFSVTGVDITRLTINLVPTEVFDVAEKIVILDAQGGSLLATDFLLRDVSTGYALTPEGDLALQGELLTYRFVIDEALDQIYLVPIGPGARSAALLQLAEAPHAVWGLGADAVLDRQHEIRDLARDGVGVWLRGVSSSVDDTAGYTFGGFDLGAGYDQETVGVVGGVDFSGAGWSAGLSGGSFDGEIRSAEMDIFDLSGYGFSGYGGWSSGPIFATGLLNYTTVEISPTGGGDESESSALGAQAEVGWRLQLAEGIALEPLAALSWLSIDGNELEFDNGARFETEEINDLSIGIGARVTGLMPMGGLTGRFAFTGRAWQPLGDGEQSLTISGDTSSLTANREDNQDILGDVGLTAGLEGWDGRLSLTATGRLKFKESYQDSQLLLGLRYSF